MALLLLLLLRLLVAVAVAVRRLRAARAQLGQRLLNHAGRVDALRARVDEAPGDDVDDLVVHALELRLPLLLAHLQLALGEDLEDDVVLRRAGAKRLGQVLCRRRLALADRQEDGGDLQHVVQVRFALKGEKKKKQRYNEKKEFY